MRCLLDLYIGTWILEFPPIEWEAMLRTLDTIDILGKRVVVRVDFNVTVKEGRIVDDFRIRAVLPTIRALKERGAATVILLSHWGRPESRDGAFSLEPLAAPLRKLFKESVRFVDDCVGEGAEDASRRAMDGSVVLLENLRFYPGEEVSDPAFVAALARLGDCFVNEAFGVSHRSHASVVGLARALPSVAGLRLAEEVAVLSKVRDNPQSPFVAVMGGKKISDKLPLIEHFLSRVSTLLLGGALANTVLKAWGSPVGRSLVEEEMVRRLSSISLHHEKLALPSDVVVSTDTTRGGVIRTCDIGDVREDEYILDIGPGTAARFAETIKGGETVFWNGPMGRAEIPAFRFSTEVVTRAIADSPGFSVVGGGDTTRYPFEFGVAEKIGFLSTGGGAMLEFLSGRALPGIAVLEE